MIDKRVASSHGKRARRAREIRAIQHALGRHAKREEGRVECDDMRGRVTRQRNTAIVWLREADFQRVRKRGLGKHQRDGDARAVRVRGQRGREDRCTRTLCSRARTMQIRQEASESARNRRKAKKVELSAREQADCAH